MRECIRCKAEMIEDLIIRDTGDATRLIITNNKFFAKSFGKVKAAVLNAAKSRFTLRIPTSCGS